MKLRLLSLSFHTVDFLAYDDTEGWERLVNVAVHTGQSWHSAVRFPHIRTDTGQSLGTDELDAQVRERAAEELIRLEAAINIAAGRWAA
jgi:hypothetical protein